MREEEEEEEEEQEEQQEQQEEEEGEEEKLMFILLMRVVWGFFAYSDNKKYMSPSHHVCRQSPSTSSLLMSNCSQFVSSTGHKTRLLPPFHKRR